MEILIWNTGNRINLGIPAPDELHVMPKIFGKMTECVSECDEDSEDDGPSFLIGQTFKSYVINDCIGHLFGPTLNRVFFDYLTFNSGLNHLSINEPIQDYCRTIQLITQHVCHTVLCTIYLSFSQMYVND